MATYNSKDNQIKSMEAINILVSGKTDTELLNALIQCIMDNDNDLLSAIRKTANETYNDKTRANVEVMAAIIYYRYTNYKSVDTEKSE